MRHCDESYDHIVLVGGFSKAYSSLLAFIACPTDVKDLLKVAAPPYLYSGPSPVASLATVLAGFDVNETRGDELRARAARSAPTRVLDCLDRLRVHTPNRSGFPIVEIPLRDHNRIGAVGQMLFDRGVYVTLAAYPLVPKDEVGFRVQLTAANTDAEIDLLIAALEELAQRGELQPARAAGPVARGGGLAMRRRARDSGALALWQLYLGARRAAVARSTCGCRRSRPAARSSTSSASRPSWRSSSASAATSPRRAGRGAGSPSG